MPPLLSSLLNCCPVYFLRQGLSLHVELINSVRSMSSREPSSLPLRYTAVLGFCMGARDAHSGPHACQAKLFTGPSTQPSMLSLRVKDLGRNTKSFLNLQVWSEPVWQADLDVEGNGTSTQSPAGRNPSLINSSDL